MNLLGNLCGVPGVRGAAIFLPGGSCVESRLPAPYEPGYVYDILSRLLVAFESLSFVNNTPLKLVHAQLTDGTLSVGVHARYQVTAIADPTVNPMMLNVALGALDMRMARTTTIPVGVPPPSLDPPRVTEPNSIQGAKDPFAPGVGSAPVSDFSLDSRQLRAMPTGDVVPLDQMRYLLRATADAIGPMAKVVIKREVRRLGFSTTSLPRSELPQLIVRVAAKIERADMRARYESKCRRLLG